MVKRNLTFLEETVVHDQLLLSDLRNGRIQVLTTELEHVKQIGSRGTGNGQFKSVQNVATDRDHNMYVSENEKNHIQVINKEGNFVRSFSNKGSSLGNLDIPKGVCVDDRYDIVYIVESGNKCVSVFHKDGQFVTSFGNGHLFYPCGVAIDSDSFVYVCDNGVSVF